MPNTNSNTTATMANKSSCDSSIRSSPSPSLGGSSPVLSTLVTPGTTSNEDGVLTQYMKSEAIAVHIGEAAKKAETSLDNSVELLGVRTPNKVDLDEEVEFVKTAQTPCGSEKGKKRKKVPSSSSSAGSLVARKLKVQRMSTKEDEKETCVFCQSEPCHDILYGTFCIEDTLQYIKTGLTTEQSLYNHFSRLYHSAYKFQVFKTGGVSSLRKIPSQTNLPGCMMNNSFGKCLLKLRQKWKKEHAKSNYLRPVVNSLFGRDDSDQEEEDDSEDDQE